MRRATLKKKVTSAKHKPAGRIVMPGGLTNAIKDLQHRTITQSSECTVNGQRCDE